MNGMTDSQYNMYKSMKTSKELWESLNQKYKTRDVEDIKLIIGHFLDYKIVDYRTVISQVQELQVILHDIHSEGMMLREIFQVAAIIEKLPPAWKDLKNYLKHKRNEMNVEELIIRIRIEEDNNGSKKRPFNLAVTKVNVVEHLESSRKNNKNKSWSIGRGTKLRPNKETFKKKFTRKCFNCNKCHKSSECKKSKKNQANLVAGITADVKYINLAAVVSEVNLLGSNPKE